MKKVDVGIDLGTTYSTFATFENGKVNVLKNSKDSVTTPSVVYIENGETLIGEDAKEYQRQGNTNTASFYKSRMGDNSFSCYLDGKEYSAADLSAIFLENMKKDIEETNGIIVDHAVITVPAYFNDKQREATLLAGKKAGLNVVKIINEPTSAIIAYGLNDGRDKTVMVYDLGGGTFDVTIAEIKKDSIQVISTNGNHQLGGKDWDEQLKDIASEQVYSQLGVDIHDYPEDDTELGVKCEEIKKRLTMSPNVAMNISCDGRTAKVNVGRSEFDERTSGLLQETFDLVQLCFQEIGESRGKVFSWKDLDEVVLVGGSTRMPQIKERIRQEYGREPVTKNINVDTIVASGAAMQVQLSLHSTISLMVAKKDEKTGKVSVGTLTLKNSSIQDITAHGLGMISKNRNESGYVNSIIIPKNSKVNQVFSRQYTFHGENLDVYVLQGESTNPVENDLLGYYVISGMDTSGDGRIIVNFLYNSNGIVEVSAVDGKGRALQAQKQNCDLSIEEILAKLADDDEKRRREAEANRAIELTIAIDTSYSMEGKPIQEAKKQAMNFVSTFKQYSRVKISVAEFNDDFRYTLSKSSDFGKVRRAIDALRIAGCTNAFPIGSTYRDFDSKIKNKFLIILTDGYWSSQEKEIQNSERAKKAGIRIYAIGIGDARQDFLNKISSGDGIKVDLSDLGSAFNEVASSIATEMGSDMSLC